ncbi:MAG: glycoside hydrolase family 3 protein, partial [Bacteroidetes bacterium]
MKTALKWGGRLLLFLFAAILIGIGAFFLHWWHLNRQARKQLSVKRTLTIDGYTFRDLNDNGRLDPYEDARLPVDVRVEDLLAQMTLEEKVGLMWHPPIGMGPQGEILNYPSPSNFFFNSTLNLLVHKKLRFFNLFRVAPAADQARWHNELQRLAEQDRLGIPVTISSDPRHGVFNFIGSDMLNSDFSKWPEPIGLAAAGDSLLTLQFGRIAAAEYRAVGIHTALHPMADLATEPRWARINGTFGADAALAARMTEAYVRGFQGDTLGPHSVACMTKHWPGGGPQEDGWDAHFRYGKNQVYPGHNFDYHLIPFQAAFRAGTAMIMPYYGVPKGQTPEDVGMNFNRYIIDELLRKRHGFDGIVCTDWGVVQGFDLFGIPIVEAKD